MKKRSKRLLILVMALCALVLLSGCMKYSSSYKAGTLMNSNSHTSPFMEFSTFSGTMAYQLNTGNAATAKIEAKASLAGGSAKVWYDDGTKKELFSISGGEEVEETYGPFESNTVYIIVESAGEMTGGSFHFTVK